MKARPLHLVKPAALAATLLVAACGGGQPASSGLDGATVSATTPATGGSSSVTPTTSTLPDASEPPVSAEFVRQVPNAEVSVSTENENTSGATATADSTTKAYRVNVNTSGTVQSVAVVQTSETGSDALTAAARGADGKYTVTLPMDAATRAQTFIRVNMTDGNSVEIGASLSR